MGFVTSDTHNVCKSIVYCRKYIGGLDFVFDQTLFIHPVNILLPVFCCLAEEGGIRSLHERQKGLTGLFLHSGRKREVLFVLIVEQNLEAGIRVSLEIIKALVAHSSGVISVTGTRKSVNIRVLRSFCGSVLNKGTERSSGSPVVVNTRHNVRHYILVVIDETNISPRHKPGYRFDINMLSGRETVNGYTDGRSL